MARPQFQAELVSAWLSCIHHSNQCSGNVSVLVLYAQKCGQLALHSSNMWLSSCWNLWPQSTWTAKEIWNCTWKIEDQIRTYKGSAAFLSACLYESFLQMWHMALTHVRWNICHGYLHFQALLCTGTTSHLPGILINRESSTTLLQSPSCASAQNASADGSTWEDLWYLHCHPLGLHSHFGETGSYISRVF